MEPNKDSRKPLEEKVEEMRLQLRRTSPEALAKRTNWQWVRTDAETGWLELSYWGSSVNISHPDLVASDPVSGSTLMAMDQALLLAHLQDSDGTLASGRWIAFSELPNGTFYTQAFQGYTGQKLLQFFGSDHHLLSEAAKGLGGQITNFADLSFIFQVMPNMSFLLACWLGDEDFPSSYRILFDAAAPHQLSTDGCAILGSMLTGKLIRAVRVDR